MNIRCLIFSLLLFTQTTKPYTEYYYEDPSINIMRHAFAFGLGFIPNLLTSEKTKLNKIFNYIGTGIIGLTAIVPAIELLLLLMQTTIYRNIYDHNANKYTFYRLIDSSKLLLTMAIVFIAGKDFGKFSHKKLKPKISK